MITKEKNMNKIDEVGELFKLHMSEIIEKYIDISHEIATVFEKELDDNFVSRAKEDPNKYHITYSKQKDCSLKHNDMNLTDYILNGWSQFGHNVQSIYGCRSRFKRQISYYVKDNLVGKAEIVVKLDKENSNSKRNVFDIFITMATGSMQYAIYKDAVVTTINLTYEEKGMEDRIQSFARQVGDHFYKRAKFLATESAVQV